MLATLTTLLLLAPAADVLPGPPVLITKGTGYYVHAIPGVTSAAPRPVLVAGPPLGTGLGLYHTTAETGAMRLLLTSGTTVSIIPMGIDRVDFTRTRIAGVAADAERLYVLVYQRHTSVRREAGPIREPAEYQGRAGYDLIVFRLADAMPVQHIELKQGDFPKEPPTTDTVKPGPLVVKDNVVTCYGVSFTFKGSELIERRYEKKPGEGGQP